MFGRDKEETEQQNNQQVQDDSAQSQDAPMQTDDASSTTNPSVQTPTSIPIITDDSNPPLDLPAPVDAPIDTDSPEGVSTESSMPEQSTEPTVVTTEEQSNNSAPEELDLHDLDSTPSSSVSSDLNAIKLNALQELSPLIHQLDQTPDEKYMTAKMVYEVTDDQSTLSAVYEAAKGLTDEKAKAAALYDVIQKINSLN